MALDFAAGCLGGCAGVLVGHPFDTIKVRLQTQDFRNPQYKGTFHCFKSILRTEKVAGLYKGMSSPMAGVAVVNAIVFGVYGNIQRKLPDPDAVSSHFIAGSSAGFAQSFVCSPMELAKTRLQLQGQGQTISPYGITSSSSGPRPVIRYKNPLDCLVQAAKQEGLRKGVFRGLGLTLTREIPGCGTYFLSYELLNQNVNRLTGKKELTTFQMAMAGGIAGTISWVLTYPVDVLKSRLQADGMDGPIKYKGVVDCLRKSINDEGYGFLVRGLNSTIIRAFPVNAATFTVVTWMFRWFGVGSEDGSSSAVSMVEGMSEGVSGILREVEEPVARWLPGAAELTLGKQTQVSYAASQFDFKDFLKVAKGFSVVFGMQGTAKSLVDDVKAEGDLITDTPKAQVAPKKEVIAQENVKEPMGLTESVKMRFAELFKEHSPMTAKERRCSMSRGSKSGAEHLHLSHADHGSGILAKLGYLRDEKIGGHLHLEKDYPSIELF